MRIENLDPRSRSATDADDQLSSIEKLTGRRLRALWSTEFGSPPPPDLPADLFRLALAWRAQAQALGGLSSGIRTQIADLQFGLSLNPNYRLNPIGDLTPGTVMTREWKGTTHSVYVLENGFAWQGRTYRTMTAAARAITGTHWSGPMFFGLDAVSRRRAAAR